MNTPDTPLAAGYHHDVDLRRYIGDPCPEPSLSTGVVCDLVERTPRHARAFHPRLGRRSSEGTPRGDIGSAVHAVMLGGAPVLYAPDEFDAWRKDAAKEFRDGVRADGGIPLLAHQRRIVERAAEAGRRVLDGFGPGRAEVTMTWQAHGVWMRGRADWLTDDGAFDIDVKTVDLADPLAWVKSTVLASGLDVQAALRATGHETLAGVDKASEPQALFGVARKHLWLLVEIGEQSTHDAALVGVADDLLEIGKRKVAHAAKRWRACLDSGDWPGYGSTPVWASAPSWAAWDLENRGVA